MEVDGDDVGSSHCDGRRVVRLVGPFQVGVRRLPTLGCSLPGPLGVG